MDHKNFIGEFLCEINPYFFQGPFNKVLQCYIFMKQNLRFELVGRDTEIWLSRKAKSTKLGDHKD